MNEQQELELPLSAEQLVPAQQVGRQWHRRRRFVGNTNQLVIAILLLIVVLLWVTRGNIGWVAPRTHSSALVTYVTPRAEQPTSTVPATPALQTALIASQVDSLLTNQVIQQQFSGSVLIAHDGQVLLSKGYSMADWDHQVPNTPDTRFYLGSVTKQFTAMAILILQERGKLHVRDRLCSYITSCPPAWRSVTIYELLTHTSGLPHMDGIPWSGTSTQAWIANYGSVPLDFTPGSQYSYCNTCYQILGYVVEQASGEPYSIFLQQAIFKPLQMRNTGFDLHDLSLSNHAAGYASWQVKAPISWSVTPQWSFLFASGLLYSTVKDLYRWDQALYTHTLVSQQSLNEAFTPHVPASQYAGSGYGYGWFIAKAPVPGHRLIWHDGRIEGFRTFIERYPDDRVTIIFLSNLATLDELALANALERIVFAEHEHQRLPVKA